MKTLFAKILVWLLAIVALSIAGSFLLMQRTHPMFMSAHMQGNAPWLHLWAVPFIVILCYVLARQLTSPLRDLKKAVERFGKGDFSARVSSGRGDELGQLGRAFDQMADQIETLVAGQRRLLLDISHELRSPLTRLGLAVELARSEGQNNAALDRIQMEADRLNALIGEILWVSRSDTVPSQLRSTPLRLDHLLEELVAVSSVEASSRQCRFEFVSSVPVSCNGDTELLRRAFENVIRNAIQHAPENTSVEINMRQTGSEAIIQIRDYGAGVPEASLPHLFNPFYRVESDRSRSSGGVGLGLAIARRSIELHDGYIEAQNAHPGLLVEIRLPLYMRPLDRVPGKSQPTHA